MDKIWDCDTYEIGSQMMMRWLLITYSSNLSVLPYSSTYLSRLLITYLSKLFVLPYSSTYSSRLLITYLSNLFVLPYSSPYSSRLLITYLSNLFVLPFSSTYSRTYLHMQSLLSIIFQYSYTACYFLPLKCASTILLFLFLCMDQPFRCI